MNPRKPPRLATWLLNRFGVTRWNPPLAGDLLEEFCGGRSAAWYWRQTIAVIFAGLVRNARLFRRLLIANLIGWVTETGVTFALWWFDYPRQLHGAASAIGWVPLMILVCVRLLFPKVLRRKRPPDEVTAELMSEDMTSLVMSAGGIFIGLLMGYCVLALLRNMSLADFTLTQIVWLAIWIHDILLGQPPGRQRNLGR